MMIPKIDLEKYNYKLPKDRIADFPLEDRSKSKLLCVNKENGAIIHKVFSDLPGLIPQNSLLIFNNTKVIAARLNMQKDTGGKAELLCIEPSGITRDPQIAMQHRGESNWICIVGGKKINTGRILISENNLLKAEIMDRYDNKALVRFFWETNDPFAYIIERSGCVPLPPYIKREPVESDKERYQTVYANYDGSVAAPTAGLHFTEDIMKEIAAKGISSHNVTLHVGPGTFKPIESTNISSHDMHREMIIVGKKEIQNICGHLKKYEEPRIIAVGTTSVRTIETLYWLGAKLFYGENLDMDDSEIILKQWTSYEITHKYGMPKAIDSYRKLLEFMENEELSSLIARTKLFIVPGYKFGVINGILTNYHLPKSTLILLVAAFLGDDLWRRSYEEALDKKYRFLSYGDSSLLL